MKYQKHLDAERKKKYLEYAKKFPAEKFICKDPPPPPKADRKEK